MNYVNDHPQFEKRMGGQGNVIGDLEWDVKSYFILGGAVHDAAIAAWGIKGYYDYVRPFPLFVLWPSKDSRQTAHYPTMIQQAFHWWMDMWSW